MRWIAFAGVGVVGLVLLGLYVQRFYSKGCQTNRKGTDSVPS